MLTFWGRTRVDLIHEFCFELVDAGSFDGRISFSSDENWVLRGRNKKKKAAKCKHIIMDFSCFVYDAMQNKEMVYLTYMECNIFERQLPYFD